MNERIERWHMIFSGEVQFVGFRYTSKMIAQRLALTGWVMNLDDGSVELEIQGKPSVLRRFLIQLKSQPHIHITKCTIEIITPVLTEKRFSVRTGEY